MMAHVTVGKASMRVKRNLKSQRIVVRAPTLSRPVLGATIATKCALTARPLRAGAPDVSEPLFQVAGQTHTFAVASATIRAVFSKPTLA